MKYDTTILPFRQSETTTDPLTELAREGARRMLAEALKAEADAFVASFADERLEDGRQRVVRHGFGPERQIQTGIGALDVQRSKVRDRLTTSDPAAKVRFIHGSL
jgi:hypothetical protein